jgi:thiol:disulfide interchange protein
MLREFFGFVILLVPYFILTALMVSLGNGWNPDPRLFWAIFVATVFFAGVTRLYFLQRKR